MSTENTDVNVIESFVVKYAILATPYATVVSLLYLIGYWSTFKINILNFIGLSDILKLALIPILLLFVMTGILSLFVFYLGFTPPVFRQTSNTRLFQSMGRLRTFLFIIFIIGGIVGWIFLASEPKWFIISMLVCGTAILGIYYLATKAGIISDTRIRLLVTLLVVIPVCLAPVVGRRSGQRVMDQPTGRLVDVKLFREYGSAAFKEKHIFDGQDNLVYLGAANDYVFFLSLDKSKTYVVKFSDLYFLELSNN